MCRPEPKMTMKPATTIHRALTFQSPVGTSYVHNVFSRAGRLSVVTNEPLTDNSDTDIRMLVGPGLTLATASSELPLCHFTGNTVRVLIMALLIKPKSI